MTNRKTTILIAAALVVVLLGASALYSALSKSEASAPAEAQSAVQPEDESVAAPDFTMALLYLFHLRLLKSIRSYEHYPLGGPRLSLSINCKQQNKVLKIGVA